MRLSRYIACVFALILCVLTAVVGCPTLRLWGIPCPGCGVTRAWLAFLSGDFKIAVTYNLFFLPLSMVFLWVLVNTLSHRNPTTAEKVIAYGIAILACTYNVLRIIYRL